MDYKYLRWQVIDTPGILDKPLEERNTIEMQSITALAHLRACVLFFLDISETCGFTIVEQVSLFNSIRPLFANKPLMIVLNKIDLIRPEQIPDADRTLLQGLLDQGIEFANSSCVTEEGVMEVRNRAADKLLAARVEVKMKGQKIGDLLNRLHLSMPKQRDEMERPAFIPDAVLRRREQIAATGAEHRLARDIEAENGGAGVYSVDLKKAYFLRDDSWRYDVIPELMDGHNVADFIDPEIEEKLARLDAEEELAEQSGAYAEIVMTEEQKAMLATLKNMKAKQKIAIDEHRHKKAQNSRPLILARQKRSAARHTDDNGDSEADDAMMDVEITTSSTKRQRGASGQTIARGVSRSGRTLSVAAPRDRSVAGLRGESEYAKTSRLRNLGQKMSNLHAKRGEADRDQKASKPKHLFAGKRKAGTNDRR
jgi:nucleolar GTP-binding protein